MRDIVENLKKHPNEGGKVEKREEYHIDPELEKQMVEKEVRKTMDSDFRLKESAKEKIAAQFEAEAKDIKTKVERGETPKTEPERKPEKRWTAVNGQVILDPEGEFTLTEAIKVAATQQGKEKPPVAYVYNPLTGEAKPLDGVAVFQQPSSPEVYVPEYDEQGNVSVKKMEAGAPIIINPPPKQLSSQEKEIYVINQKGELVKAEPGKPILISAPQSQPLYYIDSKGEKHQYQPGEPIIIKMEKEGSSAPSPLFQVKDKDGNLVALDFDTMAKWVDWQDKRKSEEEKSATLKDFLKAIREEILPIAGRAWRKATSGSSPNSNGLQEAQCDKCGFSFSVPANVPLEGIACPNPNCPSHQAQSPEKGK